MAFSFAELLKKQFPLAGVEAYTGSPKRMPESNPFPSESALGAFGMGGALDALSGVSMADYFNNDNWETRQVEGVSKRGEMVDRQYRMRPGDKTTTEIDKNGNEVITEKRVSPLNTSAQTFPLGEGAVGDRTAIFRNEFEGGRMPTNTVYPRPTTRSMYNRPDEYDRMARGNPGMGGPLSSIVSNNSYEGTPYIPIDPMSGRPFNNVDSMGGQGYIPNNVDLMGGQGSVANLNNTVYPKPTTRSMYNRPNEYQRMASMPTSFDGPGIQAQPIQPGMQNDIDRMMMSNDLSRMIPPSLLDTSQSEMNRLPMLINQGEDGVFPPTGPNVYGLDEGMFNEDPDDERRRLLGELLREYYRTNKRTYTSSI